jgi:uncharacterized SAM-binding protein YcdF (DUF218 family)
MKRSYLRPRPKNMDKLLLILKQSFRWIFLSLGALTFLLLVLSFTRVPYDVMAWLGKSGNKYDFKPDAIVILGGSGMPSEANLIRLYYTSAMAARFPESGVWIIHPKDTIVISEMRDELMLHKVDSLRIHIEKRGTNTREQALCLAHDYPGLLEQHVVFITSPENMRRTTATFRKAGFKHVGGEAAFENAMFVDLGFDFKKLGGKGYMPDVSDKLGLRYNFWNYLKLEINCLREFTAIIYYKLNGWI